MKILGSTTDSRGHESGYLAEISPYEMDRILGINRNLHTGDEVNIHDRFEHAMKVMERLKEATEAANKLRTLANMIELVIPSVTEAVNPDETTTSM